MTKSNYHMHTIFSDGKDYPEEYVLSAIDKGMESIGFSDHVPVCIKLNDWNMIGEKVELYFEEIDRLKKKYAGKIEIYTGFEMDYMDREGSDLIRKYIDRADYTVGSVHYVYDEDTAKYYSIEGSRDDVKEAFEKIGKGSHQACVDAYYRELIRVVKEYQPDFIGHLDVIKKCNYGNLYFNENDSWYKELIDEVLTEVGLLGIAVEVSTGGISYNSLTETYPSRWIVEECYKKKIPMVINSDAHRASDIDAHFDKSITMLKDIGFSKHRVLNGGDWVDVAL